MKPRHFHPIAAALFLRKTWLLCLLPLLRPLFVRDWPSLRAALQQEAVLLSLLLGASLLFAYAGSWRLGEGGALHLSWSLFFRREHIVRGGSLAALTVERPALLRLAGASCVTLYPRGKDKKHRIVLYLPKHDASQLAEALFPAPVGPALRPAGGEKLALALLGANGFSTLALLAQALRESEGLPSDVQSLAVAPLSRFAVFAERWLPAGSAWLLTLAAAFWGVSLARSADQTVRCEVQRGGGVLAGRGGLVRLYEFRVRCGALQFAQVKLSPLSFLLRRCPVSITADGFRPERPLLVYRAGDERLLADLLPGFAVPPPAPVDTENRSLAFFYPAAIPLALCLVLAAAARLVLPELVLPLIVAAVWFLLLLGAAWYGWQYEGVQLCGGHLTLWRQKGLAAYRTCVLGDTLYLTAKQSPWAAAAQRTDLLLQFPGGARETVRSIPVADAGRCFDFLERAL